MALKADANDSHSQLSCYGFSEYYKEYCKEKVYIQYICVFVIVLLHVNMTF